ncbi:MAG: valine--pyruvate transaminase, partial [Thermostichus sp. BF3_bins_97]
LLPLSPDYTGYGGILIDEADLRAMPPTLEKQGSHGFKYRPDLEHLQVDEQVGAILFSRPCNPTGNVITDGEVAQIVERAAAADVPVIIDSAYAIPFPHLTYVPMSLTWADNVIHCFSLSKAGLPGERVGIAIGPEHLLQPVECFQANASIHSSQLGQAIAARAIRSGELAQLSQQVIRPHYQQKMERLQAAFGREFSEDLPWSLHKAEGALFAWLWLPELPISDRELYQRLKQKGVVVVPGSPFFPGMDPNWPHQYQCVRISLTADVDQIEQGVAILSQVVEQAYARAPLAV